MSRSSFSRFCGPRPWAAMGRAVYEFRRRVSPVTLRYAVLFNSSISFVTAPLASPNNIIVLGS